MIAEDPDVVYVRPEGGGTMWGDGYSILTDAPNPDTACRFLSCILRPEVAARTTGLTRTATVVPETRALLADVEAILALPRVGGLFVGRTDLSLSRAPCQDRGRLCRPAPHRRRRHGRGQTPDHARPVTGGTGIVADARVGLTR